MVLGKKYEQIPHMIERVNLNDSIDSSGGSGFLVHFITNHPILSIELIMSSISSQFNIFYSNQSINHEIY
jgi:hypothetical protein